MEKLQSAIEHKEKEFITQIQSIISADGSNRTKIALINRHHIKMLVAIDDLVRDAQIEPQQPLAVCA